MCRANFLFALALTRVLNLFAESKAGTQSESEIVKKTGRYK